MSCREEHPLLVELGKSKLVPIVGLDYKDETAAGKRWLAQNGDPYTVSVVDRDGRVGIDWGVYGVPETFVIDKAGTIRYKQIGPITAEALEQQDPAADPRAAEVMRRVPRLRSIDGDRARVAALRRARGGRDPHREGRAVARRAW